MNVEAIKNILENCTEENIIFDEPHVSLRCEQNNLTKDKVLHILLHETNTVNNIIEDRSQVYKLYFQLNKRRQLKVIIDTLEYKKIRVRTVKILNRKLYKDLKERNKRW